MSNDLRSPISAAADKSDRGSSEVERPASLGAHEHPQKFDVGQHEDRPLSAPDQIPWGYGQDRVTAMVVDPDYLYSYWEITNDAIEHARSKLGPSGADAWLNLRVYDVTGRLFDGTNAHSYFDHRIERHDRQWFFYIGKPTSTACVEVGLKSFDGYFVRIARSGRVEFPRREPAGYTEPEWLTVYAATGPVGEPMRGRPGGPGGDEQPAPPPQPGEGAGTPGHVQSHQEIVHRIIAQMLEQRWDWERFFTYEWADGLHRLEWEGPVVRTAWEAGPFTYPVEVPGYIEQRFEGRSVVYSEHGTTHIIYGPWQVVIRGLGAHGERRILARWEMYTSWVASAGYTVRTEQWKSTTPGASEMMLGASEQRWIGSSEKIVRGGSEIYQVGASEIRLGGASETRFKGASEWRLRGASETRFVGASEYRARGASETAYAGASEFTARGASESRYPGASELRFASEARFQGASEMQYPGASEARYPGAGEPRYPGAGEARYPGANDLKLDPGTPGEVPRSPNEDSLGYPEVKPNGNHNP